MLLRLGWSRLRLLVLPKWSTALGAGIGLSHRGYHLEVGCRLRGGVILKLRILLGRWLMMAEALRALMSRKLMWWLLVQRDRMLLLLLLIEDSMLLVSRVLGYCWQA